MAAILFHEPVFATVVESGDKLFFYEVGTSTDLTVYLDAALGTPASQPLTADADGRYPPIYLDSTANPPKVKLTDSSGLPDEEGAEKWTVNEYPIEDLAATQSDVAQLQLDVAAAEGDILQNASDIDALETTSADHETRITALEADEGVGDIGKGARVRRTSTQNAPTGNTTVTFNATDFDDASIAVSNVLTVPAGVTRAIISAGVEMSIGSPGQVGARLLKSNASFNGQPQSYIRISNLPHECGFSLTTGVTDVAEGDTFQLQVFHDVGSGTIEAGAWMSLLINK